MIQAPKLACDISIVIKYILSDLKIENPRWRQEVAKAKSNAYDELYEGLDTKEERRKDIVPIGETETPSGKGRTTGQNDEG